MTAVVIRDVSCELHRRIKAEAVRHHRSMNREILAILEKEVLAVRANELPPPVKGKKPVDGRWIAQAIREARDGRS